MAAQAKGPGATAIAPGTGCVDLAGATHPSTPTLRRDSSGEALAWIGARHYLRPEWSRVVVEAAQPGNET